MAGSPLDDPVTAAHAWARFRQVMRWMMAATLAVVVLALVWIWYEVGFASPHVFIAAALGIGFTMLLTSALMGLLFLSHGTGHDDSIDDRMDRRD